LQQEIREDEGGGTGGSLAKLKGNWPKKGGDFSLGCNITPYFNSGGPESERGIIILTGVRGGNVSRRESTKTKGS